jgi:hypothetical protein
MQTHIWVFEFESRELGAIPKLSPAIAYNMTVNKNLLGTMPKATRRLA